MSESSLNSSFFNSSYDSQGGNVGDVKGNTGINKVINSVLPGVNVGGGLNKLIPSAKPDLNVNMGKGTGILSLNKHDKIGSNFMQKAKNVVSQIFNGGLKEKMVQLADNMGNGFVKYRIIIIILILIVLIVIITVMFVLPTFFPNLYKKTNISNLPVLRFFNTEKHYCPDYYERIEDAHTVICKQKYEDMNTLTGGHKKNNDDIQLEDHVGNTYTFAYSCGDGIINYPKDISTYPEDMKRAAYQAMATNCGVEWTAVQ